MARVPLVEEKEHPELSELIAKIKGARGGRLINIYRLMLHSPALASAWFDLNQAVRYGTEIDGQCRELAVIRVAILNNANDQGQVYGFLNLASIRLKDLACDPVGRSVS